MTTLNHAAAAVATTAVCTPPQTNTALTDSDMPTCKCVGNGGHGRETDHELLAVLDLMAIGYDQFTASVAVWGGVA